MTEKYNFDSVAERLANIDQEVLKEISRHMADGEKAKPMSEQEKACFDILEDVDHVGSHVNGSITNKYYSYGCATETPPLVETLNEKSPNFLVIAAQIFESLSYICAH